MALKSNKWYYTNQTVDRKLAREIELQIEVATHLELENPFYDGEAKEVAHLDGGGGPPLSADEIVGMDLRKIRDSLGIVALMTNDRNIGSCMEIAICAYAWGKPVFVIAAEDKFYEHPWIKYFATRRFKSADEFITYWNKKGKNELRPT
jgi:hypothetical protein